MADPLYLISLCPRALRPVTGDKVTISFPVPEVWSSRRMEVRLRNGIALECERVMLDTAGALKRFPPLPITGSVSEVREAPGGRSIPAMRALVADSLMPEDVLIAVAADRSISP